MVTTVSEITLPTLEWTGERFMPGMTGASTRGDIVLEHMHRYLMARDFVQNKIVLDIACGEGYGSNFLAQSAQSVFGVDISIEAIDYASTKYTKPNLKFKVGSCSSIPLPDQCIDVVISFETIEHHTEHEQMMAEIRRVLRPDGLLIISSPDKHEFSDVTGDRNPYHLKELYKEEFENLLHTYFANIQVFGQRITFGSHLANLEDDFNGEHMTYSGDIDHISKTRGINRPIYFIAAASNGKLPKLHNSFFEGAFSTLLEKDNIITNHTAALAEKTQHIHNLELLVRDHEKQIHDFALLVQGKEQQINNFTLLVKDKEQQINDFSLLVQKQEQQIKDFTLLVKDKKQQINNFALLVQEQEQKLNGLILLIQDQEQQINNFTLLAKESEQRINNFALLLQDKEQQIKDFALLVQNKEQQISTLALHVQEHETTITYLKHIITEIYASNSWRICAPLRGIVSFFRK